MIKFKDIREAKKPGRGKITIDIDWIGDRNDTKKAEKAHKIKIKPTGRRTADVTGEKKDLYSFLVGDHYVMDPEDVEALFKKIFEGVKNVRFVVEARSMSQRDLMRKFGNEYKKALRGPSMDMSDKAEEALQQWVYDNYPEDIRTDDPDEWIEWLDSNLEDFVKGKLK